MYKGSCSGCQARAQCWGRAHLCATGYLLVAPKHRCWPTVPPRKPRGRCDLSPSPDVGSWRSCKIPAVTWRCERCFSGSRDGLSRKTLWKVPDQCSRARLSHNHLRHLMLSASNNYLVHLVPCDSHSYLCISCWAPLVIPAGFNARSFCASSRYL